MQNPFLFVGFVRFVGVALLMGMSQAQTRTSRTVENGDIQLEAELVMPEGGADVKGAIVFSPGSGTADFRDYVPGFTEQLVESIYLPRDIAILYFNKRGIGESTGNWRWGSIERRADDLLAAVNYLRTLPEIDPEAIGIVGHSQGAWVVQLAGSLDPQIAYVVSLAGPTVSVMEQDLKRVEIDLQSAGQSDAAVERGVRMRERAVRRRMFVGRWFPFFELRLTRLMFQYDPAEALKGLTQPTLLAYGNLDLQAPAADSRERLNEIFPDGDPDNITLFAVDTDHFFRPTDTFCIEWLTEDGVWIDYPYSEEFRAYLGSWVDTVIAGIN